MLVSLSIFNLSLSQAVIPSCLKSSTIILVPKKPIIDNPHLFPLHTQRRLPSGLHVESSIVYSLYTYDQGLPWNYHLPWKHHCGWAHVRSEADGVVLSK